MRKVLVVVVEIIILYKFGGLDFFTIFLRDFRVDLFNSLRLDFWFLRLYYRLLEFNDFNLLMLDFRNNKFLIHRFS